MPNRSKSFLLRHWAWWVWLTCASWGLCYGQNIILHLRNGDKLSGTLISESTNSVVLSTAFADRLSIPKDLVESREEIPSKSTNQPNANPPRPLVPATGVVSELTPTNKPPATAASTNGVAKPPEPFGWHKFISEWRGEAQLGANLGFGTKEREAFTGHMKLTQNHRYPDGDTGLRNILEYDVAYGTIDKVLSDNRMEGNIKTEYDFSKRFLVYNAMAAGYDEIRQIDLQYDFGPGLGYKWLLTTNYVFKTEIGGDYQEQFFTGQKVTRRYSLRLDEDFWWQVLPKLRWDEKVEFFPEIDRSSQYRVRLETNLSYLLKENLTLTLNLVDQYDTAVPSDVTKNDLQIRSLLGIKF